MNPPHTDPDLDWKIVTMSLILALVSLLCVSFRIANWNPLGAEYQRLILPFSVVNAITMALLHGVSIYMIYAGKWNFRRSAGGARPRAIVRVPGSRLHMIARFFYSRKTVERVFEPLLADMREEYQIALAEKRVWKARWVRISYYWAFAKAIGLQSLVSTAKQIFSLWKLL